MNLGERRTRMIVCQLAWSLWQNGRRREWLQPSSFCRQFAVQRKLIFLLRIGLVSVVDMKNDDDDTNTEDNDDVNKEDKDDTNKEDRGLSKRATINSTFLPPKTTISCQEMSFWRNIICLRKQESPSRKWKWIKVTSFFVIISLH